MPRGRIKGDHSVKRLEIAEAACKVIIKLGFENASLAVIAREMGYTTGILRHYFADKAELLFFAKNTLIDRSLKRAERVSKTTSGIGKLAVMAVELLPLDAESIDLQRLITTFNGYAIGDPELMKIQHSRVERSWELFEDAIKGLQREGLLSPKLNPRVEAIGILAYRDGLADQVTMNAGAAAPDDLVALMHRYIAMLVEGRVLERKQSAKAQTRRQVRK